MNTQSAFEFRWFSLLGLSAALFLGWGIVCLLGAISGPILYRRLGLSSASPKFAWLMISERFDTALFGRTPVEIAKSEPAVGRLQLFMVDLLSTLLLALAVLHFGLVWFGIRQGETWALWTLISADLGLAVYYWLVVMLPFARPQRLSFWETPPVFWYPTLIIPIAAVLGWLGTR